MTIEAQINALQISVTELILAINVKKVDLDTTVVQTEAARDAAIVARDAAIAAAQGVDPVSFDPSLTALKNLPFTNDAFIVGNGTTWVLESGNVARTSLGLGTTNTPSFVDVLLGGLSVQTRLGDLQTAILELDTDKVARTALTGSAAIPSGSEAQRDVSPQTGYFRFNETAQSFEGYHGPSIGWAPIGGGSGATGGGNDKVFIENDQIVTSDYTIPAGKNAMSTGPITVSDGATVTVSDGSVWVVI